MEVTLSSSDGLHLRDVIERLSVLRGRGMASMYSWSCKRSYKNGFVWHDLCDDDVILPAHGSEYVLKGSELFDDFNPGHVSPETLLLQNPRALLEPQTSRSQDESSCSSSLNGRTKNSHEDELSPPDQRPCLSNISSEFIGGKCSSWNNSFSLTEYKVFKNDCLADASTQTEDIASSTSVRSRNTCTRGISTDDAPFEPDTRSSHLRRTPLVKVTADNFEYGSPPHSTSSPSSSGRTDTLESLMGEDAKKGNNFQILEGEEFRTSSNIRLKASNMIMQLISCGTVSVKDHSIGLVPNYKPRFSSSKLSSSMFSAQELNHISENPQMKLEDKEYFSGSLVETSIHNEGIPNLKRSSSFNGDSSAEKLDEKEEGNTTRTKCIPISIKSSLSKQPRSESLRSPTSDIPRISSDRATTSSCGHSKRITEQQAKHASKFDEQGNVMKIEESLLQVLGL